MKHYGDITKINGAEVPLVDIITGGSPCQDLSIAGKRCGFAGDRSCLFMEQIRIIKEMRDYDRRYNGRTDELCRPRFMVWENVTGSFSSNGGEDFRVVLEETARVVDPHANVPRSPFGQVWSNVGCILGDRWSVAWRVHDAQFWGVPQRRKRISLVADFGGTSAPEILFERKSMSGDFEKGEKIGEGDPFKTGDCPYKTVKEPGMNTFEVFENHSQDTRYRPLGEVCQTVSANWGMGGNNQPLVVSECNGETLIRRLTPLECERLQGYPEEWTNIGSWVDTNGKKHKSSDSQRYKALGNSIALPFWQYLADKMAAQYDPNFNPTMASLFDGIGGFPLVFSRAGIEPIWASEIEEFPIAVTKIHFPDKEGE